jgi:hypothetical protein
VEPGKSFSPTKGKGLRSYELSPTTKSKMVHNTVINAKMTDSNKCRRNGKFNKRKIPRKS